MDFPNKLDVPTFPIVINRVDDHVRPTQYTRNHGYLLAQSLFQTELPGEDMVRDVNRFNEVDLPAIINQGFIEVVSITPQNNRVYTIDFKRCRTTPPFRRDKQDEHIPIDLKSCKTLRVSYNFGVWIDLEFKVKTFCVVLPLRQYIRTPDKSNIRCFHAPTLFLERHPDNLENPNACTIGFVTSRKISAPPSEVYAQAIHVEFLPGVLSEFHQDGARRQNANSSRPVQADTYMTQLWSHTTSSAFEQNIWAEHDSLDSEFHCLVKNLVFIGKYDPTRDVFVCSKMGKKSIRTGKVTRTRPPFIEQSEELLESETLDLIPDVLLTQLPCVVGSTMCYTRRETKVPFRFDSGIMHSGTCQRVMIRNMDVKENICHLKDLGGNQWEGVLRSSHRIRNYYRSTSATSVILTQDPVELWLVLPFLKLANDHKMKIHIVEFIKLMLDEPNTPEGEAASACSSIDVLLDILCLNYFEHKPPEQDNPKQQDIRVFLREMIQQDPTIERRLAEPRSVVLKRLGENGSRKLSHISQQRQIVHTIMTECLPHLGVSGSPAARRFKLFHVIRDIVWATIDGARGLRKATDIHSIRAKQVNQYSTIIGIMIRQAFNEFQKIQLNDLTKKARGNVFIDAGVVYSMFHHQRKFENKVWYSFNTGKVQPSQKKKGNKAKTERSQISIENVLTDNMDGKIAMLRRFHIAHAKKNYSAKQRMLHASQYGFVCPAETPEGEKCGLVMNFSLGVRSSTGQMGLYEAMSICTMVLAEAPNCIVFGSPIEVADFLENPMAPLSSRSVLRVNHVTAGFLDPDVVPDVCFALKQARQFGMFPNEVSIYSRNGDVFVETDPGRLLRPLLVTQFLKDHLFDQIFSMCMSTHLPVWKEMLDRGVIVYLSPNELEDEVQTPIVAPTNEAYCANPGQFTHMEVDPIFLFSNMAANSTNQAHNQCIRTSYACKQRTQAAAGGNLYLDTAPENMKLSLDYPQRPLVDSVTNSMTEYQVDFIPSTNMVVVLKTDLRSNEDGVLINYAAKQRGLVKITKTVDYHAQAKAHHYIRVPPAGTKGLKRANYQKLEFDTGVVKIGTKIQFNDVLAGIVMEDKTKTSSQWVDKSVVYSKNVNAVVTNVVATETRYGMEAYTITLLISDVSEIQVGDKLASPHAQKGVCAAFIKQEDMPVVMYGPCRGMTADLVFNIHGYPSRMTKGMIDAGLLGMYAAKMGIRVNQTAFENTGSKSREEVTNELGGDGKVWMMNPRTGKRMKERLFVMILPYMRLNHLVAEKRHARNGGPVDEYNQPKAGKANNGGLRMGGMERRTTEGHGAAAFTHERMFLVSDRAVAFVCEWCGSVQGDPPLPGKSRGLCRECNDPTSTKMVDIPYSTIVLLTYLRTAGLPCFPRLEPDIDIVDEDSDTDSDEAELFESSDEEDDDSDDEFF